MSTIGDGRPATSHPNALLCVIGEHPCLGSSWRVYFGTVCSTRPALRSRRKPPVPPLSPKAAGEGGRGA